MAGRKSDFTLTKLDDLGNAPKQGMTICSLSFAITTDTAI